MTLRPWDAPPVERKLPPGLRCRLQIITFQGNRMSEQASALTSEADEPAESARSQGTGILPSQAIRELVRAKAIQGMEDVSTDQVQPASIDLRLGSTAYRLRASFLPGSRSTVEEKIRQFGMHAIDISEGAVLEVGCVYIVPLLEYLALPPRVWGLANPKSSTGRIDVLTRLVTDHAEVFDKVKEGYHGRLYAEIAPRTFSVVLRKGAKLSQLRLRRGSDSLSAAMHHRLHEEFRLVDRDLDKKGPFKGIPLTVDLQGERTDGLLGFRARQHADLIDVENIGYYDPIDYWEPIYAREHKHLILNPGDFCIYRNTGWHIGNYVPYRKRMTIHTQCDTQEFGAFRKQHFHLLNARAASLEKHRSLPT